MHVLIVSTYELGHQPYHAAAPAGALREAGHTIRCVDTSVDPWDPSALDEVDAVAFSVPMHTAMRLATSRAASIRRSHPDLPIALYGLYAPVSRDTTVGRLVDRVIAGDHAPQLVRWVDELAGGAPPPSAAAAPLIQLGRGPVRPALPARDLLPPLDRYARLSDGGAERLVGAVHASTGCKHECRHCPVPVVHGGRFRAVDLGAVLDDVEQLVALGAQHLTFADPDFLNGPTHAVRVVRAIRERWPDLTFDCTTKVDHIVDNAEVWSTFADAGCRFVISALESADDDTLARLDKGHTTAQARQAVRLLRGHGIELRPSLLPFTPWTTPQDLVELMDLVIDLDLIGNVEPVMYTIRLLVPEGSLLLDHPDLQPYLGAYDADRLTYEWRAADPRVDELQVELAALVESATTAGAGILDTFAEVDARIRALAGAPPADLSGHDPVAAAARPRLTEPWFCCAEPTADMAGELAPT